MNMSISKINNFFLYIFMIIVSWTEIKFGLRLSEYLGLLILLLNTISHKNMIPYRKYKYFLFIYLFIFLYCSLIGFTNILIFDIKDTFLSFYSFYFGFIFRSVRYLILILIAIILIEKILNNTINRKALSYFILIGIYVPILFHIKDIVTLTGTGFYRELLFCNEPSEAAFFLLTLSVFTIYLNRKIIWFLFPLLFILLSIKSSGTFLALAITLLTLIFTQFRFKIKYFLYILIGITFIFIFYEQTIGYVIQKLIEEQNVNRNSSIIERTAAFSASFKMFLAFPQGVGIGNFGWLIDDFNDNPFYNTIAFGSFHSNSAFAFMMSDLGIVGIVTMIFITYFIVTKSIVNQNIYIKILDIFIISSQFNFMILNNILFYIVVLILLNKKEENESFTNNRSFVSR